MQKENAEIYIDDLFLTYEIKPNSRLHKLWVDVLTDYTNEEIELGWKDVMILCRPKYLPKLSAVIKILGEKRGELRQEKSATEFKKRMKYEPEGGFHEFALKVIDGMKKLQRGEITKSQYHEGMANYFKSTGDIEGLKEHLRAKEKSC